MPDDKPNLLQRGKSATFLAMETAVNAALVKRDALWEKRVENLAGQMDALDTALGWSAHTQRPDKCRALFRSSEGRGRVEAVLRLHAAAGENAQFRALLDRAAHIVTGCAALLCERGCQDETDLDAFAAEIRKALEVDDAR